MTANGQPDQSRAARHVLKEYVSGKLIYCHAPKGVEQKTFHTYPDRVRQEINEANLPAQQQRALRVSNKQNCVFKDHFNENNPIFSRSTVSKPPVKSIVTSSSKTPPTQRTSVANPIFPI